MSTSGRWSTLPPAEWLAAAPSAADVREILAFLTERGTFHFPTLPNGLFSAALGEGADFEATGYGNVWIRDNVHIAHAHWRLGHTAVAARCVAALHEYFRKHRNKLADLVEGRLDPAEPMNRPHVRFRGTDLSELPEKWSHAQNDALGYFVWITCRLLVAGDLPLGAADWGVMVDLVHYFERVSYWQDEDSGHWEEVRKVSASSIGVVVAALQELLALRDSPAAAARLAGVKRPLRKGQLEALLDQGRAALASILPWECRQEDPLKRRRHDGALLFLCFPLNVVERRIGEQILNDVQGALEGPHGVRRYQGDSYWCADYKEVLAAGERTADFSDNLAARDRLLKPGLEAQWCIFNPIISCIHGRQLLEERRRSGRTDVSLLERQLNHARKSLAQLTGAESRFGPYRAPESYYCERGVWVPNDITPLLWTQANLWLCLHQLEESLARP